MDGGTVLGPFPEVYQYTRKKDSTGAQMELFTTLIRITGQVLLRTRIQDLAC